MGIGASEASDSRSKHSGTSHAASNIDTIDTRVKQSQVNLKAKWLINQPIVQPGIFDRNDIRSQKFCEPNGTGKKGIAGLQPPSVTAHKRSKVPPRRILRNPRNQRNPNHDGKKGSSPNDAAKRAVVEKKAAADKKAKAAAEKAAAEKAAEKKAKAAADKKALQTATKKAANQEAKVVTALMKAAEALEAAQKNSDHGKTAALATFMKAMELLDDNMISTIRGLPGKVSNQMAKIFKQILKSLQDERLLEALTGVRGALKKAVAEVVKHIKDYKFGKLVAKMDKIVSMVKKQIKAAQKARQQAKAEEKAKAEERKQANAEEKRKQEKAALKRKQERKRRQNQTKKSNGLSTAALLQRSKDINNKANPLHKATFLPKGRRTD